MTMNGIILIDGVEQTGTTLEVGAFCGDECRGSMMPEFFPPTSQYVVTLTVVSNQQSGEAITFRLYDHSTNQELNLTSENNTTFSNNAMIGTMGDWYEFAFVTPAVTYTYELPVNAWTIEGGYSLIAPPFDGINPAQVEGMTPTGASGDYDLYYFDQTQDQEWINYKDPTQGGYNLESGKGYLYAREQGTTLTFTTTQPYDGDGKVTLSKTGGKEFEGWNLVGNPWGTAATIVKPFYVMNASGSEIITSTGTTVDAMQGIFVIASEDNEEITFTPTASTEGASQVVLNLLKERGNAIDRAIVRFDESGTLPKFMLDESNTKLSIRQGGEQYAVVKGDDESTLPIIFKARENGTYTLSVVIDEARMDYLHLIDRKTGTDTDLLQTPSYSFEANTTDNGDRFELVYAKNTGLEENTEAKPFAHYNGKAWVVDNEGQAMLQVLDMSGRTVGSMVISGDTEVNVDTAPGVYVFRLINGDSVRTQKVVVE